MALRTIEAPGVEINEIDKSAYTPSMTGTRCYVMGYADKGTPYEPMQFTSKAALINHYGEPKTEAERYFYAACSEVINQNGILYSSRLPYDNSSLNKLPYVQFDVGIMSSTVTVTQTSEETDGKTSSRKYYRMASGTESESLSAKYSELTSADNTLSVYGLISAVTISSSVVDSLDIDTLDAYITGLSSAEQNKIIIVDKICQTLGSIMEDSRKGQARELIGVIPVITTAANALYVQRLLSVSDGLSAHEKYQSVSDVQTKSGSKLLSNDIAIPFTSENMNKPSLSKMAAEYFPAIQYDAQLSCFDKEQVKKIGVVVFKAFLDPTEGNKVNFSAVESFVGELDKNSRNPATGSSNFIDNIVNSNSEYIYLFSNIQQSTLSGIDIFIAPNQTMADLGLNSDDTAKTISLSVMNPGIEKCFNKVASIEEKDIDIVCDAGLANIAQFIKTCRDESGTYDVCGSSNNLDKAWSCTSKDDVLQWRSILGKYDNFCKYTRKDCMFIADGPRPLVLNGQQKIIRATKPGNTIDENILPYVQNITGVNTNYGAGYMDWFLVADEFSGEQFWCPPSIKAMGVYINTDLKYNYWDAPAGLNRGIIQALDCAFSPSIKQAGIIYQKNWNYAINYPNDGIVLEGQKTFQTKNTAFDRVNVRRLFLRLERQAYKVARYFVYEGNTAYTRKRLVDMLEPMFYSAKLGGGIYDYKIICDESINTPTVIDNNELRVKIGIKPVKTAEFILIDFIALATGGSFSEM